MAILKEVKFNAGEGIDVVDFNNMQRFQTALLADAFLGQICGNDSETVPDTSVPYAVGNGGACYAGGSNREVLFAEGTIMQSLSSTITGDAPKLLTYYLKNADVGGNVRPAAAVNPRWDILTVVLAEADGDAELRDFEDAVTDAKTSSSLNKRRRVTATFTWTQGVEAATPTEPATPGGSVKLCAVLVTPAMTVFSAENFDLRDYRVPIGRCRQRSTIHEKSFVNSGGATSNMASSAVFQGINIIVTSGGAEQTDLCFICPVNSAVHRVTGLMVTAKADFTANYRVRVQSVGPTGVTHTFYDDSSTIGTIDAAHPIPLFAGSNPPVWANGNTAGYAAQVANVGWRRLHLLIEVTTGAGSETAYLTDVIWNLRGF